MEKLLLLGTCVLLLGMAVRAKPTREEILTVYACEGSTLTVQCTPGRSISILSANYGRRNMDTCYDGSSTEDWISECLSLRSISVVNGLCEKKELCWIPATNRMFGDPCHNTPKYLEVHYHCEEVPTPDPDGGLGSSSSSTTTSTTTTSSPGIPPPDTEYCPAVTARNIHWPDTIAGRETLRPCPENPEKMARWTCGQNPTRWSGWPDLSQCVSRQTNVVHQMVSDAQSTSEVVQVVEDLTHLTKGAMYGGDVTEVMDMMEEIVNKVEVDMNDVTQEEKEKVVTKVNQGLLTVSSDLLENNKNESWKDLPHKDQAVSATKLVHSVERSAFQLADAKRAPTIKVEVNIVMEINIINTKETANVEDVVFPNRERMKKLDSANENKWRDSGDCIRLSGNAIKKHGIDGIAKLIFLTYQNLEHLLQPLADDQQVAAQDGATVYVADNGHHVSDAEEETNVIDESKAKEQEEEEKKRIVNTNIISASVNNREEKLSLGGDPVIYTLEHKTDNNVYNPTCAFWEYSEKDMYGNWSEFGCKLRKTNQTHTECECNHLTNFAVLMDVVGTKLADHHVFGLMLVTYFGCIISIVCLFLAWLTFQFIKNLQCDRNTIHKNLVLCLLLAEMIFLCGISQADKPVLCSIIAGFLHYFFLAAFAWMCLEGIQLYVMLVEVFEAEKSRVRYYYLAAYGLPLIVIIISAAVYPQGYGTEKHCWLCTDSGFIWAFVGPVIAVITVNIVMLSVAIYQMCKHASNMAACKMNEKSRVENIRSWLKGATVLVILLGLTWAFGLLYVNEGTVAFAYIFALLNSLQGCFIFIFHCILNEKVQKEYKRCARRTSWLPDCIRVNYGGAKAYSSTSPHSSSSNNYFQKLLSGRRRRRKSSTTTLRPSSTPSTKLSPGRISNNSISNELLHLNPAPDPPHSTTGDMTEDPNDYLEPAKIRIDESLLEGGINGELSLIEGSVVDSDYLDEYCKQGLAINVDKYKISAPNRLSTISQEKAISDSEYSDGELIRMTDKEKILGEEEMRVLKSESEQNELNNLADVDDDTLKLKKRLPSTSSESLGSSSLDDINNLNKDTCDESKKSLNISTPNIKFKPGTPPNSSECNTLRAKPSDRDADVGRSLPAIPQDVAIDKIQKALSTSDDGLIQLKHGKDTAPARLSADTEAALEAHRMRLTSSDC